MIQHVWPMFENKRHQLSPIGDCYCEPEVQLVYGGKILKGRIFVHQRLRTRRQDERTRK